MLLVHKNFLVSVSLTSLLPLMPYIYHDILLTRLSFWFGRPTHGSVLNWFKSYLLSRTFCVKCNDCFSLPYTPHSVAFLEALFLVLCMLFIMYTTPLSTLISSLSLYHRLYVDNTQLFLSFRPPDFQVSITHL